MKRSIFRVILPFVLAGFFTAVVKAEIRDKGTGSTFETIQKAIDAAANGTVIEIDSGDYFETLLIKKGVTLLGRDTGGGFPRIDGGKGPVVLSVEAPDVVIDGLSITTTASRSLPFGFFSAYSEEAAIMVRAPNVSIRNCKISGCHFGIFIRATEGAKVSDNEVSGNRFTGIFVLNSKKVAIQNNKVSNNGYHGIGIGSVVFPTGMLQAMRPLAGDVLITEEKRSLEAARSCDIEVSGNTISDHGHGGITVGSSKRVSILRNEVTRNGGEPVPDVNPPVILGSSTDIRGYGIGLICDTHESTVDENKSHNNDSIGILLDTTFSILVTKNEVSDNGVGIGLFGSTHNEILKNTVKKNANFGIRLERGFQTNPPPVVNTVTGNELSENGVNAFDTSGSDTAAAKGGGLTKGGVVSAADLTTANRWDDGKSGNHFSDFDDPSDGFTDANEDGIGEVPHPIPGGGAVDRFPLAEPTPKP